MATITEDISLPQQPLPDVDQASLARKRRRKTQSNGAGADCFACQKRGTTCDRRRPYCSQCLEVGKECSGYRTVLTWGVGVASRGKLRGMSLPVAIPGGTSSSLDSGRRRTSSLNTQNNGANIGKITQAQMRINQRKRANSLKSEFEDNKGFTFPQYPASAAIPEESVTTMHQNNWQLPPLRNIVFNDEQPLNHPFAPFLPPTVQIPQPNLSRHNSHEQSPLSSSASSIFSATSLSSYSDNSYERSYGNNTSSHDLSYPEHYANVFSNPPYQTLPEMKATSPERFEYESTMPMRDEFMNNQYQVRSDNSPTPLPFVSTDSIPTEAQPVHNWSAAPVQPFERINSPDLNYADIKSELPDEVDLINGVTKMGPVSNSSTHVPAPLYAMSLYQIPSRMQFMLDYYDKAICPVLVAFDTPSNPYRTYIMQLAYHNTGLQHAIAALCTNNMRMRDAQNLPCLTQSPESWPAYAGEQMTTPIEGPSAEEQHYKTQSIEQLNLQLLSALKAKDDSVLATLLVLCLFHICDSGVAKFKTQLAGVQKLLRMRGQSYHSDFVEWVEMFFAWLDVMTSCVNDREIQVHGDSLDLMNPSAHLGALEQYSGCDGRLFKLIARLGRLNLLSQSREIRDSDATPRGSPPLSAIESSLSPAGFGLGDADIDAFKSQDSLAMSPNSPSQSSISDPDPRGAFWHEWRDLRLRLQEWDPAYYYGPAISYSSLPAPQRDLVHLSAAFRHAALLYTERLGHPTLPSTSTNFSSLVSTGLYHCTEIPLTSCVLKFMLWPLFIIGTECVEKSDRDVIRSRCVEIQRESGFYNNLRMLRVLEKAWKRCDEVGVEGMVVEEKGFWWRSVMDTAEGEYILI